ncbi:putative transcriptional regulatory protein [Labeo rohita]|uniref:Transcriptional regulatory protein n=1 Tax=Labeo rohita TaxID=84645 RepID=A0ABQ8ME19_LABRO|nr:putative transcriptional regulatory protein [Labeo rohita]
MVRKNTRLIPTTEKGGLATPLWSDSEFKSLLGVQMNLIVTEKVRQELTKKYEIHLDKTWSVDECKKVLGACIRKNNVKGIICCHREFGLTLATQQSQRNSELEEQNKELRARISALTKKLNRNKALEKTDMEVSQPDNLYPGLPSARTNFCEFRRALISKMRLYDMSLVEVTQLMSQILTESEFNSFESAVTSELRHASKADLREGVLKILKNIMGPKIDWSRITNCVQKKEETVSEYTEKFCQSAVTYSGIVDDPESVLDDKGPLVRIWSDGLVAEYRKALPFLDLTWSNKTLRSNLDTLATWERDSDVKAKSACNSEADPPHYTKLVGQLAEVLTVKAGQTRTHRPVRSPGKNRSATGLGGQPCGEDFLIGFSPHQFVPTSLVCVHAMMSSKAASWSKASPQTPMNKLHKDKESSK